MKPLLGRVLELPDDPDDRQREHDRQVEHRLVEARAAELAVEQDGEQHPDRRGDEHQQGQPDEVVGRAGQKNG